jgi:hypothetical protein
MATVLLDIRQMGHNAACLERHMDNGCSSGSHASEEETASLEIATENLSEITLP